MHMIILLLSSLSPLVSGEVVCAFSNSSSLPSWLKLRPHTHFPIITREGHTFQEHCEACYSLIIGDKIASQGCWSSGTECASSTCHLSRLNLKNQSQELRFCCCQGHLCNEKPERGKKKDSDAEGPPNEDPREPEENKAKKLLLISNEWSSKETTTQLLCIILLILIILVAFVSWLLCIQSRRQKKMQNSQMLLNIQQSQAEWKILRNNFTDMRHAEDEAFLYNLT